MMMFIMMQAFGISLIALAFGVFSYIWANKNASSLGKFFGVIIIILSIGNLLCTTYYAGKYWFEGDFTNAFPMQKMMQNSHMMDGSMMNNGNMPNMMNKKQ